MAFKDHLDILKEGADIWNKWRAENQHIIVDLTNADFRGDDLNYAELSWTRLDNSDFSNADLEHTRFHFASAKGTLFNNSSLIGAIFESCMASGANFTGANLSGANFHGANLRNVDLSETIIFGTNFLNAMFRDTNLTKATSMNCIFANVDLSKVKGLESVIHANPSIIGIETIYISRGKIPEPFLRGAGVPESLITYMASLVADALDYYSCFISYSSKNQDFAETLYADLQDRGVRCWYAPENLKIGDKFRERIDESIWINDKLLLILSEESILSPWVEEEAESAIEREHREKRLVLFPIRIDDSIFECNKTWAVSLRRQRHIGDFTQWKDKDSYLKSLNRLLRDLKSQDINERRGRCCTNQMSE